MKNVLYKTDNQKQTDGRTDGQINRQTDNCSLRQTHVILIKSTFEHFDRKQQYYK